GERNPPRIGGGRRRRHRRNRSRPEQHDPVTHRRLHVRVAVAGSSSDPTIILPASDHFHKLFSKAWRSTRARDPAPRKATRRGETPEARRRTWVLATRPTCVR